MLQRNSSIIRFWKKFKQNKPALIGLFIMCFFIFVAIFADVIVDYDLAISQEKSARLLSPCKDHWFGTDNLGRDVFARVVHGSRISLSMGLISTTVSLFIGGLLGVIAGYFGGWIDTIITRTADTLMCIPSILFSLCIIATLGASTINLLIAITVASVPGFIRILRATVIAMSSQEYIDAAKVAGSTHSEIIRNHILPNAVGMIIVQATMSIADMIIFAAGLSFLGLGVQPPRPEWGIMLSDAKSFMREYPHLVIFPGLSIAFCSLSLNLFGDGLRDLFDPRSIMN